MKRFTRKIHQDPIDTRSEVHRHPNVTLVVPNYNHARYLAESLGSIAAQTRVPDRVLIIDDASNDESVTVISRFIADHPSWELIRHDKNRGVVSGQNEAIAAIDTDWIGFLGADDALCSTYLEKALAAAYRRPEVGLICACCETIGLSTGRMLRPMMLPASKSTVLRPSEVRRILLEGDNYFPGTVSLYRREAIRALGGFQESFGSFADSVVARQLALTYGFYFLADILGYWRIHDQSYSMISLSDPQALSAKIADIQAMIVRSDLFPPGYDALFDRRTRFGAARIALAADAPVATKAASIAELLNAKDGERRLLQILLRLGQFGRLAALAWITLQTRPMSISKLLGQFSARRAIIAATPAYRTP